MNKTNLSWILMFVAACVAVVVVNAIKQRVQLRDRLLNSWQTVPESRRQDSVQSLQEAYQASHALAPSDSSVDDLTWHDLNMQAVFKQLNQTESSVGSEAL